MYRGLSFKGHIGKFKHNARIPMKPSRNATDLDKVQMWMKNSFLESDKTDCVAKDDVWMKFRMDMQKEEVTKSVVFSLLGNTAFKNLPFPKVTGMKREGKVSHYQYLRDRFHSPDQKTKITICNTVVPES